jgi:hypothetical protein
MFAAVLSVCGSFGPLVTNVLYSYIAYCAIKRHLYAWIAGLANYLVLNEFDSIKRDMNFYAMIRPRCAEASPEGFRINAQCRERLSILYLNITNDE